MAAVGFRRRAQWISTALFRHQPIPVVGKLVASPKLPSDLAIYRACQAEAMRFSRRVVPASCSTTPVTVGGQAAVPRLLTGANAQVT
jgi:hypothetical protein